jgi:hypothetical protein
MLTRRGGEASPDGEILHSAQNDIVEDRIFGIGFKTTRVSPP